MVLIHLHAGRGYDDAYGVGSAALFPNDLADVAGGHAEAVEDSTLLFDCINSHRFRLTHQEASYALD